MTKQQELEKLANRRSMLGQEVKTMHTLRDELTRELGQAIISGSNSDKIEVELAKVTGKMPGMEAAVRQADEQLSKLTAELTAEQQVAARNEAARILADIETEYLAELAGIVELGEKTEHWRARLDAVKGKLSALHLQDCPEDVRANGILYTLPFRQIFGLIHDLEYLQADAMRAARATVNSKKN